MRLTLRAPPLLTNFLGLDLKLGASIISLFAVLNKVAGAYGMLAVLQGGTLAQPVSQLTMYAYSLGTLVVVLWGLKKISEENGPKTLLYAHLFAFDHFVGTIYTALFAVMWYVHTPHDGRRVANSEAQKAMMGHIDETMGGMTDQERAEAAQGVWKSERGFAAAVLIFGWFTKIYFILCLYSFAMHLRRNTYASLPKTRPRGQSFYNVYTSPQQRPGNPRRTSSGPRYNHLRVSSIATDPDTDTTLAETLWEEEELMMTKPPAKDGGEDEPPISPAVAKGTGMTRSMSGGVLQRTDSGSGQGGQGTGSSNDGTAHENSFTRILNKV